MKTRLLVLGLLVASLSLVLLAGSANDVFTGTWTNENLTPHKIVCMPGDWKQYSNLSDTTPFFEVAVKSADSWTDTDGNIWFRTFATIPEGYGKGREYVEIDKLSKNETVWEYTWRKYYGETDPTPEAYPTKIDPTDTAHYGIYYRAKE